MKTYAWFKLAGVSLVAIFLSFILIWGIQQFNQNSLYNNPNAQMNRMNIEGSMMGNMPGMNMNGSMNVNGNMNMHGGMMMDDMMKMQGGMMMDDMMEMQGGMMMGM